MSKQQSGDEDTTNRFRAEEKQSKFRDAALSDRLDDVKALALRWVQADARDDAEVAVVSFETNPGVEVDLTALADEGRSGVYAAVEGISPGTGACMGAALREALAVLGATSGPADTIIMMTDGVQVCVAGNDQSTVEDVLDEVEESGARVITYVMG